MISPALRFAAYYLACGMAWNLILLGAGLWFLRRWPEARRSFLGMKQIRDPRQWALRALMWPMLMARATFIKWGLKVIVATDALMIAFALVFAAQANWVMTLYVLGIFLLESSANHLLAVGAVLALFVEGATQRNVVYLVEACLLLTFALLLQRAECVFEEARAR